MGYIRLKYVSEPPYLKVKSNITPTPTRLNLFNAIDLQTGEDTAMSMPSVSVMPRKGTMMRGSRKLVILNYPTIEIIDL